MQPDVTVTESKEALGRVLASDEFRGAGRLLEFLRYVVEETLAGRPDGIKATTIAMDVFDRGAADLTGADSIVRVTAARLRRKLSYYYSSSGKDDPVRIKIDPGSYVPRFIRLELFTREIPVEAHSSSILEEGERSRGRFRYFLPVVLVLGIALGVAITYAAFEVSLFGSLTGGETLNHKGSESSDSGSLGKPFVVVLPLTGDDDSTLSNRISGGYVEAVIAKLSKLSGLSVMAARSSRAAAENAIPVDSLRRNQGVTHVLSGSIGTQSERIRISVQLFDAETNEALFAERFEGNISNVFELEDRVANRIAGALFVSIDDDESRRIYLRHTSNYEAIDLYRKATVRINPPNERARVEASRSLHQRVIDLEPEFAGGYAGLSQVHSYMVLFRHSAQPELDLQKAIEFGKKAIELDSSFSSGHAMLGLAYALSGETDLAIKQVRRAVALDPGDPLAYQWLGGVLVFSGKSEEAVSALLEAIRLDPLEPGTPYLNILGMAYFNIEAYEDAITAFERSILAGGPRAPNMEAYRAATYAALGRETDARNVLASLNVKPNEISPEHWIRRWTPSGERNRRAIESLYRLGLENRDVKLPATDAKLTAE